LQNLEKEEGKHAPKLTLLLPFNPLRDGREREGRREEDDGLIDFATKGSAEKKER